MCEQIGESRIGKDVNIAILNLSGSRSSVDADMYYSRLNDTEKFINDYFYNPYDYIESGILKMHEVVKTYSIEKQKLYLNYCNSIKKIIDENKEKYIFNESIVTNIRRILTEYNERRKFIENSIEIERDVFKKIKIRNELFSLKEDTLHDIRNMSDKLIDYPDILEPTIDEMIAFYIEEYLKTVE